MEFLRDKKENLSIQLLMKAEQKLMDFSNKIDNFKPIVVPQLDNNLNTVETEGENEAESLKNKLFGLTYNNFGCTYKQ